MLRILAILLALTAPALADCSTETDEARITEKITQDDTVYIFQNEGMTTLLDGLKSLGLLVGIALDGLTKVYVIPYKNIAHIFFIDHGCIVGAYDIPLALIKTVMPQ